MSTRRILATASAIVLAATSVTFAQVAVATPAPSTPEPQKLKAEERGGAPANLTLGPSVNPPAAQFLFETNKDTQIGTAAFGWKTGHEQFQVSVSGPLRQGSTEPLNLGGLPAGATAKLSWNYLRKKGPSALERKMIREMCEPVQQRKMKAALEAWEKKPAEQRTPDTKPSENPAMYACFSTDFNLEDRADFDEYQHLYDPAWLFGLDGSVAHTEFEYVDDAFADQSDDHFGGSASARGGIVAPAFVSVFVSYKYTQAHRAAGDPSNICTPIPDSTSTNCRESVRGAPVPIKRSIASVEFRRFFGPRVATSPSVHFDFLNGGNAEFAVPIYYMGDGTGATGGVRFNYRTDKQQLTAVVFIGATLGLLPK